MPRYNPLFKTWRICSRWGACGGHLFPLFCLLLPSFFRASHIRVRLKVGGCCCGCNFYLHSIKTKHKDYLKSCCYLWWTYKYSTKCSHKSSREEKIIPQSRFEIEFEIIESKIYFYSRRAQPKLLEGRALYILRPTSDKHPSQTWTWAPDWSFVPNKCFYTFRPLCVPSNSSNVASETRQP